MAKVIFLAHKSLYPVLGGDQIRMVQTLEWLAAHPAVDELHVVTINHDEPSESILDQPTIMAALLAPRQAGLPDKVITERVFHYPKWRRLLCAARRIFSRQTLSWSHYWHRDVMRHVRQLADQGADTVVCASKSMVRYAADLPHLKRYVDFTDSFTMNRDAAAKVASTPIKKFLLNYDSKAMRRLELMCRRDFDAVAYISDIDADYVGRHGSNVHIVSNGLRLPAATNNGGNGTDLLFIGRLNYSPNIVACRWFADYVMPILHRSRPDIYFRMVGADATAQLAELASRHDNVELVGQVPDLEPWFLSAAVVVAPMQSGSGIQNKILQAMGYACPVATTSIGAEGLTEPDDALMIADNPETMARQILSLLDDQQLRLRLGANARNYVNTHFSPKIIDTQLSAFLPLT